MSTAAQSFAGLKTFVGGIVVGSAGVVPSADLTVLGGVNKRFNGYFFELWDNSGNQRIQFIDGGASSFRSRVQDLAAAVGHIIDTAVNLTVSGAKLLSIRNAGSEKIWVGKDGDLNVVPFNFSVNGAGVTVGRITGLVSAAPSLQLQSNSPDGATTVAFKADTTNTLANAAAKLFSWLNNTVEKAFIDKDGNIGALAFRNISDSDQGMSFSGTTTRIRPGAAGAQVRLDDPNGDAYLVADSTSGNVHTGRMADGGAAVAHTFDTGAAYSNASAKLASFKNNGTEKAYIDKDGNVVPTTDSGPSLGTSAKRWLAVYAAALYDAINDARLSFGSASSANTYTGTPADGASAVAHVFNSKNTLSNAAAKLASFQNNGTEKFAIDKDGKVTMADGIVQGKAGAPAVVTFGAKAVTEGQYLPPGVEGSTTSAPLPIVAPFAGAVRMITARINSSLGSSITLSVYKNGSSAATVTISSGQTKGTNIATVGTSLFTFAESDDIVVHVTTLNGTAPTDVIVSIGLVST